MARMSYPLTTWDTKPGNTTVWYQPSVMTDLSAHRHQRLGEHGRPVIAMTVGWAAPAAEQNRLGHPSGGCVTLSKTFDTDASSRRLTVWLPYAE
ncbi:hypothetical protein JCM18920_3376 [Cutibacterium acnes JCM 18920]|nr:hypothetical protein JCM18920_3376 [Cutibacterium acnes JCM 18920]